MPTELRPTDNSGVALRALAEQVGAVPTVGSALPQLPITGVTLRAQAARPGDLFAALPGAATHGARYVADAIERGASAVLTDAAGVAEIASGATASDIPVLVHPAPREVLGELAATVYRHPSQRLTVIGITGTSGKTTTTYLVEAGLRAAGRTAGLIGTVGVRIDGVDLPSALTTPEAPALQALLALMLERGVDTVVMEVSSHALTLGRVDGTRFAVGGFTNLSRDHLDFHPTMADYFDAKARLFDPAAPLHAAKAVVCVDDDAGAAMAERAATPITVSATGRPAQWGIDQVSVGASGGREFTAVDPAGVHHLVGIGLPGDYNVANCLLALGILDAVGVSPEQAAPGLRAARVPGRMEPIERGQDFLALVDYAHKPGALAAVLQTLRDDLRPDPHHTTGRLAVVFGAGGDRDHGKRDPMGQIAAELADLVVVTDDNPRGEDPADIRRAVLAGAADGTAEVVEIGDRRAAIGYAVDWARPGDVVLVAGKGHETGQTAGGRTQPFDDRVELAAALERAPMIALTVAEIAEIVGGRLADITPEQAARTTVTGTVEFDSRRITPGSLFLALPGARVDGHDHAASAVAAGAVAVLAARPIGVPAIVVDPVASESRSGVLEHDDAAGSGAAVLAALAKLAAAVSAALVAKGLTIVGVTGSSGKTSTKDLIAAVLAPLGQVVAPPGSFNNELGHPWTVLRADENTDYLVLELSARHRGNIAALAAIAPPQVAVVLNVGTAHLGEFGSREAIADTKAELAQAVRRLRCGDPQRRRFGGGGDGRQDRRAGGAGQPVRARRCRAGAGVGRPGHPRRAGSPALHPACGCRRDRDRARGVRGPPGR